MGIDIKEYIGASPFSYIHQEDIEYVKSQFKLLLEEKTNIKTERRWKHAGGNWIYIEIIASPIRDKYGDILHFLIVSRNITDRKRSELVLKQSEEFHSFIAKNSTDIISRISKDFIYTYISPAIFNVLGYEQSELIGENASELICEEDREYVYELFRQAIQESVEDQLNITTMRYRFKKKDGTLTWLETTARAMRNDEGILEDVLSLSRDISDRVKIEKDLVESKKVIAEILESITDGFFALDENFNFTYINNTAEKILGKNKEEIIGQMITAVFPKIIGTEAYDAYRKVMKEKETVVFQEYYDFKDAWYEIKVYPKEGIAVYIHDITHNKRAEEKLRKLSIIDGLTGVANRRYFDKALVEEWQRCESSSSALSLIMLDVDYFKLYNDTYGHIAGDECLKAVAKEMGEIAHRRTDISARYGGEEFAIILPETNAKCAVCIAEKLRLKIESLSIPHKTSYVKPVVACSLGVASMIPDSLFSPESLIIKADEALYESKYRGRNQVSVKV